jgi:hypothetical protein
MYCKLVWRPTLINLLDNGSMQVNQNIIVVAFVYVG